MNITSVSVCCGVCVPHFCVCVGGWVCMSTCMVVGFVDVYGCVGDQVLMWYSSIFY